MQSDKKVKVETPDEKRIRNFNFWNAILIIFIVIWLAGAFVYLDKKTDIKNPNPPIVVLDSADGLVLSNMFSLGEKTNQVFPDVTSKFELREKYDVGDIIVVKFFYVEGVIMEKNTTSDSYTIIYKDHNHVLQLITLPRQFLLYPKAGVLNPVSLLVD